MADILNVSFKIDTGNLEGDAAAAGRLAAQAFQTGFGSINLTPPLTKAAEGAKAHAAAIGEALRGAAVAPHAAPIEAAEPIVHRARERPAHGAEPGGGGEPHGEGHEPKLSGFENAVRGIGAMRLAFEGLSQFLQKGSLSAAAKSLGEIGERAAESAVKVGLIGEVGLKVGGVATSVAGMAHFLGKEAGEYSESAQEEVLGLDSTSKMSGVSMGGLLGLKGLFADSGVPSGPLTRGLSIMNLRQQQQRAGLERELSEEPLETADQQEKVAGAYRKREDAADSLATAEERIIGTRAREATTIAGAAIRDQIAKEKGPMDVVAAMLGLGEAQEGQRHDTAMAPLNIASAVQRYRLAQLGPEREDLQFAEAKEGIQGAQVNYGSALIQARAADIRSREAHGEVVSREEKRQLAIDSADHASVAAWEHVREAGLGITAAKLHRDEVEAGEGGAKTDIGKALEELISVQRQSVLQQRGDALRVQGALLGARTANVTEREREVAAGAGAGAQGPESLTPEMQKQRAVREAQAALRQKAAATGAVGTAERDAIREEHIQELQPQTQPGQVAEALAGTYKGRFPIDLKSTDEGVIGKALTVLGQSEKYSGPEGAGTLGALQDLIKRNADNRDMDSVVVAAAKSLFGGRNANPEDASGRSTTAFIRALTLATKEELADAWHHKMTPEETEKFGPENVAALQKASAAEVVKRQSDEENRVAIGSAAAPGAAKTAKAEGEIGELIAPFIKNVIGTASDVFGWVAQEGLAVAKPVAGAINAGNEALSGGNKETQETLGKIESLGTAALGGAGGIFAGVKGAQFLYGATGRAFRKWAGIDKGGAEAPAPEAAAPAEAPAPEAAAPAEAPPPAAEAPAVAETSGLIGRILQPLIRVLEVAGPGLNVGALVSAGSEAGNKEAMADPKVIAETAASDAMKSQNITAMGFLGGSLENLKESFGFGGAPQAPANKPTIEAESKSPARLPEEERTPAPPPPAPAGQAAGGAAFNSAAAAITSAAGTLGGAGSSLQGAAGALQSAAGALSAAAGAKQSAPPEATSGPVTATEEHADGGLISGPGSGTSDSIPAWLSHGEYIVKADSVQKLGVPFLDRLNAGGFAFGGLVRGFAEGGAVDDDQAKRKAALEQLRLKMPLFGRGIFDDPDWATPLGDKIRLEHADKIRPPAAVGGGSDDASPPSLPMQRAEMWRSRSIRSHPAVESPDVKERPGDEMADVAVDYGWGNKKTFSVHKNKSPTPEQGPENAGNLDGYRWQGGILWKGGTPISDQTGERELGGAQPHQHHEPHQPTGLETPFESLPAVHAPIAEHPHHAPHRRRADASDDDMWNPDRKLAFGGLIPGFASSGGLARVSNGEYRIGAGAVTKYGAGVMAMLNSGRFESGGLVGDRDTSNPGRFDDWGNGISRGLSASLPPGVSTQDHGSSSQHTLDLVTSAGQFRMQASQDTIEAIRSSAIGQKLTSAGTKPSWY